ncbi:hypothetical protein B0H13DRAFT_2329017 [Mycena leptocephala]|nr:hypothetical protein B0H13DRAFT_2329017 [Mycena leptocephala]
MASTTVTSYYQTCVLHTLSMSTPKSFRSRMGSAMRRSSSELTVSIPVPDRVGRPPTPGSAGSSSSLPRRSSISRSLDGRKSSSALDLPIPPPEEPAPALPQNPVRAALETVPIPDAAPALESNSTSPAPKAPQTSGAQTNSNSNGTPTVYPSPLPQSSSVISWPAPELDAASPFSHPAYFDPLSTNGAPPPSLTSFAEHGWIEYARPDAGSARAYYVHPTWRVTTDTALRVPAVLEDVAWALGGAGPGGRRAGLELWLRDEDDARTTATAQGKARAARRLVLWWVDHGTREVSSGEAGVGLEAHLDMEYRYWAFVEDHPADVSLPLLARRQAMDVLTWARTDRLLSADHQSFPPPFTQSECQELLALLRSLNYDVVPDTDTSMDRIVLTRAVSHILLRIAQWRQHHFRPHKPLPTDAAGPHHYHHALRHPPPAPGLARTTAALASLLLLGVPSLFSHRVGADPPGAAATQHALPTLLAGTLASLLAAGLLGAVTTLLAVPGLGGGARRAALAAGILAAGAMVVGPIAILRYKATLAAPAPLTAGEPLFWTQSVIMALPLVLLIYALGAFGAAVGLYAAF